MIHSYSSIATFKQCPAKWNWTYRDRFPHTRETSPQMERGTDIHNSVEEYLKGTTEFLHADIHQDYGQFMMTLRENYTDIRTEFKWGITREFESCGYSDANAMLHGFFDLMIVPETENLLIYEWKTGKSYPEHIDQAWMYSVAGLSMFPEKTGVETTLTYFDQHDFKKIYYPQGMMGNYKPSLLRQIDQIESTTEFIPMPSWKCRYCPFSRHNGGPCAF